MQERLLWWQWAGNLSHSSRDHQPAMNMRPPVLRSARETSCAEASSKVSRSHTEV
jgi:hypothetical protein